MLVRNFPKLSNSLTNLCTNILRDFGFHTSIIVGGPIVRDGGRLSTFTWVLSPHFSVVAYLDNNASRFESPGTMHKNLTFSESCGNSYDTEVSHKFIEYLKLCFRTCSYLNFIHRFDPQIVPAKESRQLYTLNPTSDTTVALAVPSVSSAVAVPQSTEPATPVPQPSSTLASIGPIRTARKSQTRKRPLPTRVNKSVPSSTAGLTNATVSQVEVPRVQLPEVSMSPPHTPQVSQPQAVTFPSKTLPVDVTPIEPSALVTATTPPDSTPLPATQVPDDGASDTISFTSTLPDVFDVGVDDSAPPATGTWMITDHYTGEVIVDDQSTPPAPTVLNTSTIPTGPSLARVEVTTAPHLGTPYLVEMPPVLLSEDEDVRPQWLITAVNKFLRFVPYVGSLGKVVDLYLTQEARLGYPRLVRALMVSCISYVLTIPVHSQSTSIPQSTN